MMVLLRLTGEMAELPAVNFCSVYTVLEPDAPFPHQSSAATTADVPITLADIQSRLLFTV